MKLVSEVGGSTTLINYYEVLGVTPEAPPEEIKRSFRRLAKKYHPDRNRQRTKWAADRFRAIRKAYDTLSDEKQRSVYDQALRRQGVQPTDPYRSYLESRRHDPHAQARLILHCLLNEEPGEAIQIYERMRSGGNGPFELYRHLEGRDYLDCEFLLGEAYEHKGDWRTALGFYENVYSEERDDPQRYFLEEVKERIRDMYCKKLARSLPPGEAIRVYERVLAMGLAKKTEAYIHKKIAECYYKIKDFRHAKAHLMKAFGLEPRLKGAQKICEKLGIKRK